MRPAWPRAMPGEGWAGAGGALPGCGDAWPWSLPWPWAIRAAGQGAAGQVPARCEPAADRVGSPCTGDDADAAEGLAEGPLGGLAGGPARDRPGAELRDLAEALIGLTRTEAEARVSAFVPGSGGDGCVRRPPRLDFRTAGPLRPGTLPRVVRARWRSRDVLEAVCAGFLAGPGGCGPRDPEVRS